jgi:hypothetical protein
MSNVPDPRRRPPAVKTLDHTVAAVPLLQGRVLLHEHAQYTPRPRPALDADLSGVVMTGANADSRAFQLRTDVGYQGTLLIDSAVYTTYTATTEEPFMTPPDELFATVHDSLSPFQAEGSVGELSCCTTSSSSW